MYGLIGKLTAAPGHRDALAAILRDGTRHMPGCLSYIVSADATDADGLWITEVWDTQESHRASLALPAVKAAIAKGKPLIAGFGQRVETVPLGGVGIRPAGGASFATTVIYVEKNIREVLDFYRDAFGFAIRYYDDELKFGELETGGTAIMIASYEAGVFMVGERFQRSPGGRPADVEIAFVTADVPAAFERAVAAGARPVRAPRVMPWGQTAAYVESIEGTLVGLLTPPPPAPPTSA